MSECIERVCVKVRNEESEAGRASEVSELLHLKVMRFERLTGVVCECE